MTRSHPVPLPLPDRLEPSGATWEAVDRAEFAMLRLHDALTAGADSAELVWSVGAEPNLRDYPRAGDASQLAQARLDAGRVVMALALHPDHGFPATPTVEHYSALQAVLAATAGPMRCVGRVRDHWIGVPEPDRSLLLYAPSPAIVALMGELAAWREGTSFRPLLAAAVSFHAFVCIHPFSDCNGRLARAQLLADLVAPQLLASPCLDIEWFRARYPREYFAGLEATDATGDWEPVVCMVAYAVEVCAAETVRRLARVQRHVTAGLPADGISALWTTPSDR